MSPPLDEGAPSPEVKAFFTAHAQTGEPDEAQLASLWPRVEAATALATRPRARLPLSGEWLAVAALVLALLAARGVFIMARGAPEAQRRALEAYRAGDVEGAVRIARAACGEGGCDGLEARLTQAASLASRLETLSAAELEELRRLDGELAPGGGRALVPGMPGAAPAPIPAVAPTTVGAVDAGIRDAPPAPSVVRLRVGESAVLEPGGALTRVALGNGEIADVEVQSPVALRVKALAAGGTTVMVYLASGESRTYSIEVKAGRGGAPASPRPAKVRRLTVGETATFETKAELERVEVTPAGVVEAQATGPRTVTVRALTPGAATVVALVRQGGPESMVFAVEAR